MVRKLKVCARWPYRDEMGLVLTEEWLWGREGRSNGIEESSEMSD